MISLIAFSHRRPQFAAVLFALSFLLLRGNSGCVVTATADDDASNAFYDRYATGTEAAIEKLRALHRQNPKDPGARLYLAWILAESGENITDLSECFGLLDGLEKEKKYSWIQTYCVFPRLLALQRLKKMAVAGLSDLAPGEARHTSSPAFAEWLDEYLVTDAADIAPLREAAEKARAQSRSRVKKFTGNEIRADIRQLAQALRTRWCFLKEKQVQLGRTLEQWQAETLAQVQEKMSRRETTQLLARAVAELGDSHTQFRMINDDEEEHRLPCRLQDTAQGVVVAESVCPRLQAGDLLLSIDDTPIEEIVARLCSMESASNSDPATIRHGATSKLTAVRSKVKLRTERGGKETSFYCPVVKEYPWSLNYYYKHKWITNGLVDLAARKIVPVPAASPVCTSPVGYVRVNTWCLPSVDNGASEEDYNVSVPLYKSRFTEADAALAPFRDCSDIIVDIRGNGGGMTQLANHVATYLCADRSEVRFGCRLRVALKSDDEERPKGVDDEGFQALDEEIFVGGTRPAFKARVWLLTDGGCCSASYLFAHLLVRCNPRDRVHTVGRPCDPGAASSIALPMLRNTGAQCWVSRLSVLGSNGQTLEGKALPVDIPVTWTRDDILAGRDADIEAAVRAIEAARAKPGHGLETAPAKK